MGKSASLRTGFGVVIGLLVISTFMAWRIQETFSRRTVEIHRRYVQQQEAFTSLRRVLWLASISTRDYFLNPAANRLDVLRRELDQLANERDALFAQLRRQQASAAATGRTELDRGTKELEQRCAELWRALERVDDMGPSGAAAYEFVQQELVPRREAARSVLRRLEAAHHTSLYESEEDLTASRRAAGNGLLIVLGLCLLTGAVVTYRSLRYSEALERKTSQQFAEVSQAKQELERLSARLMEIQEEERTRLSRELHDEIVQTLAVLKIEIGQAQSLAAHRPQEVHERLGRARELAERTIRTARNIMLLLRPSLLDDLGLEPALQWLAEDFRRRTGVPCDFEPKGLQDELSDAVKTCVYRVVQEALHNCEKHSHAKKVRLDISQLPDRLSVVVHDNGIGFRVPDHSPARDLHFGLIGMRERAQSLGGLLSFDSTPGHGARVHLELPLLPSPIQEPARMEIHA